MSFSGGHYYFNNSSPLAQGGLDPQYPTPPAGREAPGGFYPEAGPSGYMLNLAAYPQYEVLGLIPLAPKGAALPLSGDRQAPSSSRRPKKDKMYMQPKQQDPEAEQRRLRAIREKENRERRKREEAEVEQRLRETEEHNQQLRAEVDHRRDMLLQLERLNDNSPQRYNQVDYSYMFSNSPPTPF